MIGWSEGEGEDEGFSLMLWIGCEVGGEGCVGEFNGE